MDRWAVRVGFAGGDREEEGREDALIELLAVSKQDGYQRIGRLIQDARLYVNRFLWRISDEEENIVGLHYP